MSVSVSNPSQTRHRRTPKPHVLTAGILFALISNTAVLAQSSNDAEDLDAVVVTGIRGSLQSSMNLKRDSFGVIDGVIAEDIGKFPDTNLAESMQRISGVSIDRTLSGEGSKVTVRGIGSDFNLVLLNGRQMPATSLAENLATITGSRAFDFANLASEAVSALEVYKTTNANIPTGGIGATINIKTARPLDKPGLAASLGVKGMMDRSIKDMPQSYSGKSITPEISGIFSNTFLDGRLGIALNGSYQERDGGFSRARANLGWRTFPGTNGTLLPLPGDPNYADHNITNRPGPDDIYSMPRNILYSVSSERRQRRNGQATLQFAPTDTFTATLDYTYADNRVQQDTTESQVFAFNYGPGASSWTNGPISAPIIYTEYGPGGDLPVSFTQVENRLRSELKSTGLNLEWQVSDDLDLAFDYHDSISETRPDSPLGSGNFIGSMVFVRGDTTVDYSGELPILSYEFGPGITGIDPSQAKIRNSGFRSGYNRADVEQGQLSGTFRFADYQALDFGLASTEVKNRSAFARASGSTGELGNPGDFADGIFYVDNMGKYLRQFKGHNDPRFSDQFLVADFHRLRERAIELTGREDWFTAPSTWTTDQRIVEKTRSAYLQWRNTFDWTVPVSVNAGMRYENTRTDSASLVRQPVGNLIWHTRDELRFDFASEPVTESASGKYHHWLPSLDLKVELAENLVVRNSYSKSIGRARWNYLQSGMTVNERYLNPGTGDVGNAGLLPLESRNIDLSVEWYYGEGSYASLGYFRKSIKKFVGLETTRQTPYPMYSPIGGAYWNEALTIGGCPSGDAGCIRNWIFANRDGQPGVNAAAGTITGQPGDPFADFNITTPTNQRSDTLDGFELNVQHMFGESGVGVAFNYTKVDSGLTFDDYSLETQYPMQGLSDSGNLVLFYDKHGWQVRAAYNWRDKFLNEASGSTGGSLNDPDHTESYGQLDVNVTWDVNENLSVFVEGINLSNETQRTHGRHWNMLRTASQSGPRYMFGARYKF